MGTTEWTAAIAFVRVDQGQNPNVVVSAEEDAADPYYRAMTVTFASLRRWNPDLPLVLVSNEPPRARYAAHLERLGVEVQLVPFRHRPPEGFAQRFTASLFMLDAMAARQDVNTVFVDPDVLCIRGLHRMLSEASIGAVGVVPMPYPADYDVNGLTPRQAGELHALLGEPVAVAEHFGGECLAIPAALAPDLLGRAEQAWSLSLDRHAAGLSKFTTEEHLLSFAQRGVPTFALGREVRRVWTAARYRTVDGAESELTLWHLPAEKDRGFQALFSEAIDPTSWFWSAVQPDFVRRVGRVMGLHGRPPRRFLRDTAGQVLAATSRR